MLFSASEKKKPLQARDLQGFFVLAEWTGHSREKF